MSGTTCRICGADLNRLTIFEKGVVKRHSSWCVNSECSEFRVLIGDIDDLVNVPVHTDEVTATQS